MKKNRILFVYCDEKHGYSIWDKKDGILNDPYFDPYYDKEFLIDILNKHEQKVKENFPEISDTTKSLLEKTLR